MIKIIAVLVLFLLFLVITLMKRKNMSFMSQVLMATLMGAILGYLFAGNTDYVAIFGRVYAHLLQAFVIPMLLFSIISTVASLESIEKLSTLGAKTLGILSLHNILGSIIALIIGSIIKLGSNSGITMQTNSEINEVPPFSDVIVDFFPNNIVNHMVNNNIIPIVLFAILIGVAILRYKNKEDIKPFTEFIEAGNRIMTSLIGMIVKFTPYAVLSLLANQVATLDFSFVKSLLLLLFTIYIACLFHTFITTSVLINIIGRINPITFQKKFFPAWLIGFTTQSSIGTMPANIKAQKDMGTPEEIASFSASVGTTFGMPGCAAIWPILLAIFTINTLNLDFTIGQYIMMIGSALLASIGTIGVPGTGTVQATALFAAMGLPVEMILVLTPIAGMADMARTSTNVHAAGSTGVIVASLQKQLDKTKFNSKI